MKLATISAGQLPLVHRQSSMAAVLLVLVMVTVYAHAQDSQLVGSSVQEQRVRAPQDLLAAGTGDHAHRGKDDQGYRRTHSSKGGNGYVHNCL